jgi:type II secretory pathway pseudopilin PulG
MKKLNSLGFTLVEGLLIVVIVGLITGVGFYVWHSKQATEKNLDQANQSANSSQNKLVGNKKPTTSQPTKTTIQYFEIKEWGVRAPISNGDTFTYKFSADNKNIINVISKNLSDKYQCTDFGAGQIARGQANDMAPEGDKTYQQDAAQNPDLDVKVGNYYYRYFHDQAGCSNSVTADAQNQANDYTKGLMTKLQVTP